MMRYLDVCAGISAASVAWAPLGWQAAAYAEIDPFPRAVLEQRHGAVAVDWDHRAGAGSNLTPLFGDFTLIEAHHVGPVDLLVGGTPCQSFSVAGKRLGLDDPRGNLTLEFLALARRLRPRWLVWENVPGVLSDDGGRTMGTFLRLLGELGYRWAYRVLDAQYVRVDGFGRAVPQRRRRVFVVGHLGAGPHPGAVLFDPESLRGLDPPRREPGQAASPTLSARTRGGGGLGTDFDLDGGLVAFGGNNTAGPIAVSTALKAHDSPSGRLDFESDTFIAQAVAPCVDASYGRLQGCSGQDLRHGHGHLIAYPGAVVGPLKAPVDIGWSLGAEEADKLIPIAFDTTQLTNPHNRSDPQPGGPCHPLTAAGHPPAVAFDLRGREGGSQFEGPHDTANIRAASGGSSRSYVAERWRVRRLTPRECERLQGFPDDFTLIAWRGRPAVDGRRYKAVGNSMAVNAMRWIGRRIELVERAAEGRP